MNYMIGNPLRAEARLVLDGEPIILRMNLGALAVLENVVGAENLADLINRFGENKPRSEDLIHVLNAGLYGSGHSKTIQSCRVEGGATEAAKAAAILLAQAFPKHNVPNGNDDAL